MRKSTGYALLLAPLLAAGAVTAVSSQIVTGTQDFSITVEEGADTTPDSFSFAAASNVEPGSVTESATATITGVNVATPISVSGGEYSVDGGAYTSASGTVTNGQTVRLRLTSSASSQGSASATITVGGVSRMFTATTRTLGPCDSTGIAVGTSCGDGSVYVGELDGKRYFMDTGYAAKTWASYRFYVPSNISDDGLINLAQMRGISSNLASFPGQQYCQNRGSQWALPSTYEIYNLFNNLSASQRSSYFIQKTFYMTSERWGSRKYGTSAPSSTYRDYYSFTFYPDSSYPAGYQWKLRGRTSAHAVKCVRFDTNLIADDFDPNAFAFTAQSDVAPSTQVTSNTVTISGVAGNVPISISGSGATFSVDGGAFSSASRTITDGQTVQIRLTSSATPSAATTASLTVGSMTRTFSVTTSDPDTTPDAFAFTAQSDVQPSTETTSNSVTIAGLVGSAPVSVSGGASYSISGGVFTTAAGTISNGQTLRVRMTSSATLGASVSGSVTVGTVTETFGVTTTSQDTTPNAFAFTTSQNRTSSERNTLVTFDPVTVSGLSTSVPVSVSGSGSPRISVNGGSWLTSGTVTNGDTVAVRLTSSGSFSALYSATVTVGLGTSSVSVITRAADALPDAFTVAALSDQEPTTTVTSSPVTPTGYEQATLVPGSGLSVSVNGGAFSSSTQTVTAGQSITLRATSPSPSGISSFSLGFRNASGSTVYTVNWSVSSRAPIGPNPFPLAATWESYCGINTCTSDSPTVTLTGSDMTKRRITIPSQSGNKTDTVYNYPAISINGGAFIQRSTINSGNYLAGPGDTIRVKTWPTSLFLSSTTQEICIGETCQTWVWNNTR